MREAMNFECRTSWAFYLLENKVAGSRADGLLYLRLPSTAAMALLRLSALCAAVASAAAFAPAGGFCRRLAAAACVPRAAHGPPCTAQLRASLPALNGGCARADASGAGTARGVPRAPQPEAVRQSGAG